MKSKCRMRSKWNRKSIKKVAKTAFLVNYWRVVGVCLLLSVFVGAYASTASGYNINNEATKSIMTTTNSEITKHVLRQFVQKKPVEMLEKEADKIIYGTRGVLANVFNNITRSGSFLFGILEALNQMLFKGRLMSSIILLLGAVISFLYWLFVGNILRVGGCRFFLENSAYKETKVDKLLFIYQIRRITSVARVMFLRTLYVTLWSLTIVGGIYKGYAYRLVPFVLAENPNLTTKEALRLSEQLMRGNKWKAFCLDASFLGWYLISFLTLGVFSVVYVNPYKTAANAQLYLFLRKAAIEEQLPGYEFLNDAYLENIQPEAEGELLTQYPMQMYAVPVHEGRKWLNLDYDCHYSVVNLILLFFSFSFIGCVWEIIIGLLTNGVLIKRGIMYGPWIPIYGTGGVLILILLRRWLHKPLVTFCLIVLVCATVEYFTSWYLEMSRGLKWWDYTGYSFNLHGRISLEGLFAFGVGGSLGIYMLSPLLNALFDKISSRKRWVICGILLTLFAVDLFISARHPNQGDGITTIYALQSMLLGRNA
ncbi:MAG: DUF975 family protein [Lachnospiraceae bacterium]